MIKIANELRNRPEFSDIDNLVKQYFRDEFGSDIDLDDPTTAGMFAGVLSKVCNNLAQTFEGGFNSLFVLRAPGSDLDDLGAEWQVYRRPATYAFANEKITAYVDDPKNPVIVPIGSDISTADGHVFQTMTDLTFDTPDTDDKGNIVTDDDGTPIETMYTQVMSTETGYDQNVQKGTIVNADSVDGLDSCTNVTAAGGGYDQEPDDSFRKRIMSARSSAPSFSDNGIIQAINNVNGVHQVKLVDNREMTPDKYGNPGKSIHLYTVGGDDQDIANTLFNYMYPTTKTVGSISKQVTANDGMQYQVNLDHAESVPVYVHFTLKVNPTNFNEDNADSDIKNQVINYFSTLNMGDSALFSKLFQAGYNEDGVKEVSVQIGKDKNNLSMQDVNVDQFQLASVTPQTISVDTEAV